MKRISYHARFKPPRACIDPGDTWNIAWTYSAGDKSTVEVHDHDEGEQWEDTGLVDLRGDPIYRKTRFVRPAIGFIQGARDE